MKNGIPSYVYIVGTLILGGLFIGFLALSQKGELNNREEELANLAEQVGADKEQFVEDFQSEELRDRVQSSDEEANTRGVTATPTVFINGERVQNSLEEMQNAITAELETSDEPVVVEEYFDFQCPACASFHVIALQVKAEFGEQIDLQQKPYFLPNFNREISEVYAYAWEAAAVQGLGEEMESEIFRYHHGDSRYDYDLVQNLIESNKNEVNSETDSEEALEE